VQEHSTAENSTSSQVSAATVVVGSAEAVVGACGAEKAPAQEERQALPVSKTAFPPPPFAIDVSADSSTVVTLREAATLAAGACVTAPTVSS
jgi:hypothetical protein